ncbi:MAG TPA: excinuclease ABC subunit UvrC [Persephonella sp.]|nr:excinuclease ABC subunit UvrC [Persephonella sp.]
MEDLKNLIDEAPQSPGVYLFKGKKGEYIYIGKAKNIKNRLKGHLNQYRIDPKEKKIFDESSKIEWIITKSDYEAFVLENELIKQYKPKYNVRLKSGSGYPMLVITDDEYPTVVISRKFGEIEGEYFGPFLPARTARAMKDLIHKLFRLRTCDPLPKRDIVCFDYHLGLCSAPCVNKISKKDYNFDVKAAKAFLSGDVKKFIYRLYDRLEEYKNKLNFEKASVVRDQILAMENLISKQEVLGLPVNEADIFYFSGKDVYLIVVRGSRIVGKEFIQIKQEGIQDFEISVISNYYIRGNFIPEVVISNRKFSDHKNLKRWLSEKKGSDVRLLFDIPDEIKGFIDRNIGSVDLSDLKEIFKRTFGFDLPERIEGFDISTLFGDFTVGSAVVWENGKMNKREYRRFKIKTVDGIDDYASLRELLFRRFRKYKEMDNPPRLVLIDGGKGHLKQGEIVRDALGIKNLRIFSLAKKEEILYTDDGKSVYLYNYQPLLKLFTTIRDEAHRFALSYNRKLRERDTLKELLDKIEGVGKKRKEILYRTYKTVDRIAQASVEELKKLGIPEKVAQNIKKYLSV